jgi:hypothetical protein
MGFAALAVHGGDAAMEGGFEIVGVDEGPVSEVVTLQIAPGRLDLVELRGIARQPLDGQPFV